MTGRGFVTVLTMLSVLGIASAAHARRCATVYEHTHFKGSSKSIRVGEAKRLGPWNDQISSIKVARGCVFNAYEHTHFKGEQKSFSGKVRRVGDDWNDRISSYTCTCR